MHARAHPARRWAFETPIPWVILLITVLALVLRLHRLAEPVLRWDEGWSLAHASLPWAALWQVAAEEWHPPAYVALLKLWLVAGRSAWSIRMLSVLLGVLAVPLAYAAARAWSGKVRVAALAAGFAATWPLLVYYGQVTRMYALAALAVLAAVWLMLRGQAAPSWRDDLGLALSSAVALYTFYQTAWALAGLWAYAAIAWPRRIPRLLAVGLATIAAFIPWLLTAHAAVQQRLGTATSTGSNPLLETLGMLRPTLAGLAFIDGTGWHAAMVLGVVLVGGLLAGPPNRSEARKLLLPTLVLGLSALGTAYSARAYWFAARHLVPACTFLGLALAWSLDRLVARWRPLLPAALLALVVAYWPAGAHFVYEKTLEVVDPFDPGADHRYLAQHAGPGDLVYFNVLARAGWYESLRGPGDPAWRYAMRWDPVIEPLERITARITRDAEDHPRLWFALYKGDHGPNAPLVEWLQAHLYPAGGEWQGDMLYLAYVIPEDEWAGGARSDCFEGGICLTDARWTPSPRAGGAGALTLTWCAERPVPGSYKVFVHATDGTGRVLAQHDGIPAAGTRPTNSWPAGVEVLDRHGLLLPVPGLTPASLLHIRVGLYDPDTGRRLPLVDGSDAIELCTWAVK